jgi:hypothetical protein
MGTKAIVMEEWAETMGVEGRVSENKGDTHRKSLGTLLGGFSLGKFAYVDHEFAGKEVALSRSSVPRGSCNTENRDYDGL